MDKEIIKQELEKCARCGKCRSVCPVFYETGNEGQVARGRILLTEALLSGNPINRKTAEKYLASCLKCLRCVVACPSGVRYDRIILGAISELGAPWWMRLFFRVVLMRRSLFNIALKLGVLFQKIFPVRRKGYLRHLPLLFSGKRNIPNLAPRSALQMFPEINPAENERERVAIFAGCMLNYVYPNVISALVKFLNAHGVTVVIPGKQLCCGAPVISAGDQKAAKTLARKNVAAMNRIPVKTILTACATGGRMLKTEYADLLGEEKLFNAPVQDFSEYITANFTLSAPPAPRRLTYHDPCHLKWGQGVTEPPRVIMRARSEFVEAPDADRCCGFGGIFSMFHYELGQEIFGRKEDFLKTNVEGIVTACPGCMLQLSDQMEQLGDSRPVIHLAQLLEDDPRENVGGQAKSSG